MKYLCVRKCWHKRPGQTSRLYKIGEIVNVTGREDLPRHFVKANQDDQTIEQAIKKAEVEERAKFVKINAERKEKAKADKAAK
jgi:hypothetical protein